MLVRQSTFYMANGYPIIVLGNTNTSPSESSVDYLQKKNLM